MLRLNTLCEVKQNYSYTLALPLSDTDTQAQTDTQIHRQPDRQTDTQTDRQTDRQTDFFETKLLSKLMKSGGKKRI